MLSPVHVAHSKIVVLESQVTRDRMSTAMSIHTNNEARKVVPHTVHSNEARKVVPHMVRNNEARKAVPHTVHSNEAHKVVPHTVRNNEARKVRLDLILEIAPPQWQ